MTQYNYIIIKKDKLHFTHQNFWLFVHKIHALFLFPQEELNDSVVQIPRVFQFQNVPCVLVPVVFMALVFIRFRLRMSAKLRHRENLIFELARRRRQFVRVKVVPVLTIQSNHSKITRYVGQLGGLAAPA